MVFFIGVFGTTFSDSTPPSKHGMYADDSWMTLIEAADAKIEAESTSLEGNTEALKRQESSAKDVTSIKRAETSTPYKHNLEKSI